MRLQVQLLSIPDLVYPCYLPAKGRIVLNCAREDDTLLVKQSAIIKTEGKAFRRWTDLGRQIIYLFFFYWFIKEFCVHNCVTEST